MLNPVLTHYFEEVGLRLINRMSPCSAGAPHLHCSNTNISPGETAVS